MTTVENTIPEYLRDEYEISTGEHLGLVDTILANYWTNWSFMKENLYDTTPSQFLEKCKQCKTTGELKKLINKYI